MPLRLRSLAFCLSLCILVGIALPALSQTSAADPIDARGNHFAVRVGDQIYHRGQPFRMAGSNNYYPMYVSQTMVDNLFQTAAAQNFNAFRLWAFLDVGNQDGTNSVDGPHNGVYFQYFDGKEPAYNDGATGLQHLDYVIYRAGQLNLKLILPLVNNYDQFGGMDQYVRWAGGQYHDQFYTDTTVRKWYKAWIKHLLNHTNIYTGIKYKDDATIMIWELANEERCAGYGVYPQSSQCTTQTITSWANDVSLYIKSIDSRHLVSPGSEGFYCKDPSSYDFTINCSQGVDAIALAKLPAMDVLSYHLYPDSWGKTPEWGTAWIAEHIADSHQLGDRAIAGEWGLLEKNIRNPVYNQWEETVLKDKGAGALYWILSAQQDDGTLYPDYDGYTVYCPTPVCSAFTHFARKIQHLPTDNAPIADNDTATTANSTPALVNVTANDITYGKATLVPASINLDPAVAGLHSTYTIPQGTFTVQSGGNVQFEPANPCVIGGVTIPYTIRDSDGRTSNPANLTVTVGGIPGELYDFEDGTDTWAPASFSSGAGTVSQSTVDATHCQHDLQINPTANGGWFGPAYNSSPLPLSTKGISQVSFDITTTSAGTSQSVAMQFGSSYTFCQTPFGYQNAGTTTTLTVNLASLATAANCGGTAPPDTSVIQGIFVYFNGGGASYLDNVHAQ